MTVVHSFPVTQANRRQIPQARVFRAPTTSLNAPDSERQPNYIGCVGVVARDIRDKVREH
jgi:hypothetical protein